jgi:hypothetical protein
MKKLILLAVAAAALALPGAAKAGCMATVGLSSKPKPGLAAGQPWVVTIRVLQHGRTPMPDAKPEVRIRNAAGKLFRFKAKKTAVVGSYRARVVFPAAGLYKLGVYDGFPFADCARVHNFKSVLIYSVCGGGGGAHAPHPGFDYSPSNAWSKKPTTRRSYSRGRS